MIEHPVSEGFRNISNVPKFHLSQQSFNIPSGIQYCEKKGSKIPKTINMTSTGLRRSARLANKPRQKYVLFTKFILTVMGACDMDNNPHVFLTRENKQSKKINRHFDGN